MKDRRSTHRERQPEGVDVQYCRRLARRAKVKAPIGCGEGEAGQAFTLRERWLVGSDNERTSVSWGPLFQIWIRIRNRVTQDEWEQRAHEGNENGKLHDVQTESCSNNRYGACSGENSVQNSSWRKETGRETCFSCITTLVVSPLQ